MQIQETFKLEKDMEATLDWKSGEPETVELVLSYENGIVVTMGYIPVSALKMFANSIPVDQDAK